MGNVLPLSDPRKRKTVSYATDRKRRGARPVSSKATTRNPKDLMGSKKVSLSTVPAIALAHEACALMDGSAKYGPYNWRDKKVVARIYIDACKRHLDAWLEGQESAADSGVHHLGHARACLAILLDAQETGNLIDDRPKSGDSAEVFQRVMNKLNQWASDRKQAG